MLGSKRAPEASSPWASSLVEARFNKGLWMAQSPGDSKASRGPAPFNKDNFPRQNGRDMNTYVVRGLLLAVALAIHCGFYVEVISSGEGVNPRSSNGVQSGRMWSLDVFRKLFRSVLLAYFRTTEWMVQILALYSALNCLRSALNRSFPS